MTPNSKAFQTLVEVIARLRDPNGGCPWDLEQTHTTLRPYVVEEAYEVVDAIEGGDDKELCGELGDLLLQVVLHAQIASERGAFTIENIVTAITEKMVRRHPHVFGDVSVSGSAEVLKNWEQIKRDEVSSLNGTETEKPLRSEMLERIPKSLPALLRSQRLGEKAGRMHFDWTSVAAVWAKVREEFLELEQEVQRVVSGGSSQEISNVTELEHEIGDLLFSITQLSRWLKISAEDSLRACCDRFLSRFKIMEQMSAQDLSTLSQDELESLWQQAKGVV